MTNIFDTSLVETILSSDIDNSDFIIIGNVKDIKNRKGYALFPGEQISLRESPKEIWVRMKDPKAKPALLNWISV